MRDPVAGLAPPPQPCREGPWQVPPTSICSRLCLSQLWPTTGGVCSLRLCVCLAGVPMEGGELEDTSPEQVSAPFHVPRGEQAWCPYTLGATLPRRLSCSLSQYICPRTQRVEFVADSHFNTPPEGGGKAEAPVREPLLTCDIIQEGTEEATWTGCPPHPSGRPHPTTSTMSESGEDTSRKPEKKQGIWRWYIQDPQVGLGVSLKPLHDSLLQGSGCGGGPGLHPPARRVCSPQRRSWSAQSPTEWPGDAGRVSGRSAPTRPGGLSSDSCWRLWHRGCSERRGRLGWWPGGDRKP